MYREGDGRMDGTGRHSGRFVGRTVVLAVTGSIAAYKMAGLASRLVKAGARVQVLMTENATNFINPITFETLTSRKCLIDTFDRNFNYSVEHVALAKEADVVLVAPASANVIGKLACGIADDMLTTTVMACTCHKIVSPAMNTNMYFNQVVQDNLGRLRHYGWEVLEPESGRLACGDVGAGKLPDEEVLFTALERALVCGGRVRTAGGSGQAGTAGGRQAGEELLGKHVLVTAGATRERLDPVRFLSNHSTGKMGCAVAREFMLRGADVTLVCGHLETEPPLFVRTVVVESAAEMFEAVTGCFAEQEVVVMAAAVADYTPAQVSPEKIKKTQEDFAIPLKRTQDILAFLGEHKTKQFLCGFSMETENLLENSRQKLVKKNLDLIAANNIKQEGAGFAVDTNVLTLISADGTEELPLLLKTDAAGVLVDRIVARLQCAAAKV